MFTGIIEDIGEVIQLETEGSNLHITIKSKISSGLKVDQSVSHNGVCLTVVKIKGNTHVVTAIKETLKKTTLSSLQIGDKLNLERAMLAGSRFDGHLVQGHVDQKAKCIKVKNENGSWYFTFKFCKKPKFQLIKKGSVCIDGVSLTVVKAKKDKFSVAIIPYTFEHTGFSNITIGSKINIEFDILTKIIESRLKNKPK